MGETIPEDAKILSIKKLITKSCNYEEEFCKEWLQFRERLRKEEMEERERLRKEDMEERERVRKEEIEERRRREEMQYELERLKLQNNGLRDGVSDKNMPVRPKFKISDVMPCFDSKENDISLYLVTFERQAKRAQIPVEEWVVHLIGLMPRDIAELIAREPEEAANNFDYVKILLLERFKLSSEKFRQLFFNNLKTAETSWKEFAYKLRNYWNGWISGLGINTFEQLSDLMVTEQIKRKVPAEVRDHFLDEWSSFKDADILAKKLDDYANVRELFSRKAIREDQKEKFKYSENRWFPRQKENWNREDNSPNINEYSKEIENAFEQRALRKCYICRSTDHLKAECPKLRPTQRTKEMVGRVMTFERDELMKDFISEGLVNGYKMPILRDTGSSIDIISQDFVAPEMLTGETICVMTPFSQNPITLPLAEVELVGKFGRVFGKAAVVRRELDRGIYLLGNQTAKLVEEARKQMPEPEWVCAVQTRAKKRREEREKDEQEITLQEPMESIIEENGIEENIHARVEEEKGQDIPEISISREELVRTQKEDKTLNGCFQKVKDTNVDSEEGYFLNEGLLILRKKERLEDYKELVVVPNDLRERLLYLSHEATLSHLGVKKTRDQLLRYFFWPGCCSDVEKYVRSCDSCQRAGKSGERRKAPLMLVPVISEVMSKINIDVCGPLPESRKGNKYILTALCLASKYPDAMPMAEITSRTIIDTLLELFSRWGFPKELQTDRGSYFVSTLTTDFFERAGIHVVHSSVQHPQSNPVERFHRTLKRILRALCFERGQDWEECLPGALFAIRTAVSETSGFSPAELVHGRNLRTPLTLVYESWMTPEEQETPSAKYVLNLINRLKKCQELASEKEENERIKRKGYYDRKAISRSFEPGDMVLVLNSNRINKLDVHWIGPGEVLRKLSDTNYIVTLPGKCGRDDRSKVYHINMLKRYFTREGIVNYLSALATQVAPDLEIEIPEISGKEQYGNWPENANLSKELTETQASNLKDLLKTFKDMFSVKPGLTHLVTHDIELVDKNPIQQRPYRMSPRQKDILEAEIKAMLEGGIIEEGESEFTSPMILVEVPGRDPRPCIDYRKINKKIKTEYFPIPNIEERIELVARANYITVLDQAKGYWQIPLTPRAQHIAAFVTPSGTYRPLRMPFGLKNAPYFFSKLMKRLLKGCEKFALPYLDDTAVFSHSWDEHLIHLREVLNRINEAGITLKPNKCHFGQNSVKYLGHVVGKGKMTPSELKIKAIIDFPTPETKTDIRAFIGICNYYRKYIPMFATIAAPLTSLTQGKSKKGKILWTADCEEAFVTLKEKLSRGPVLRAPDFTKEFLIQTDASDEGIGVVLSQVDQEGEEHPILYLSRKFKGAEKNYSTTEKECAAILWAVKRLHCYLDGQEKFRIQTDHNPITWLHSAASSNPRLMRWALTLQNYNYSVEYRKGRDNQNADSLSRSIQRNVTEVETVSGLGTCLSD